MDYDLAIHSKRIVLPTGVKDAIIFIKNNKIAAITEGVSVDDIEPTKLHDAGNNVVMAGIIDAHVHINEPGRTDWEGFETATKAAAAGGVTSMIEMPLNATPVTTTAAAFEQKLEATEGKLHVNCGFYGGLVPQNYNDLEDLMKMGVFGIKCFMTHSGIPDFPNVTESDIQKAMPLIKKYNLPLLAHAELSSPHPMQAVFKKHPTNYRAYLKSRPKSWENRAIEVLLKLCAATQCTTHIVHLSSADLMLKLKKAKKSLPITVETTPQYLYFAAEDIPDAKTVFKCAPPIRERANNALLWEGLRDGVIDFIASDHSPAPPNIKEIESGNLQKAWGGIAGLQFSLSVVWTKAQAHGFSIEDIAHFLSKNPAKFLNLTQKGQIVEGFDADLVIWNPEAQFVVEEKNIFHKHKPTPYLGEILRGPVLQTYVGGQLVFDNGTFQRLKQGKVLINKQW